MLFPQRCLVTGGAGFIGSWWVDHLLKLGCEVTVLDDLSTGTPDNLPPGVDVVHGDILDIDVVDPLVQAADTVFHLAAVVGVQHALKRRIDSINTNVLGSFNVTYSCAWHGRPLVLASSSAVYGKTMKLPIAENDDIVLGNTHVPAWTYSVTKIADETLARAMAAQGVLDVKIVRLFNCIGPRQTGAYGMVVPRFVKAALRGEPLTVYGDGTHTRTFLYIADCVRGLEIVWGRGQSGEVYNLGGSEEITIADLARRVIELTGSTSTIRYIPFDQVFGPDFEEIDRRVPDISKIRALGYEPRYGVDDALREIVAWFREEEPS